MLEALESGPSVSSFISSIDLLPGGFYHFPLFYISACNHPLPLPQSYHCPYQLLKQPSSSFLPLLPRFYPLLSLVSLFLLLPTILLLTILLLMKCLNYVVRHPSLQKSASSDKFHWRLHSIAGYNGIKVSSDDNSGLRFSRNPSQRATSTATSKGPASIADEGRPVMLSHMQITF